MNGVESGVKSKIDIKNDDKSITVAFPYNFKYIDAERRIV